MSQVSENHAMKAPIHNARRRPAVRLGSLVPTLLVCQLSLLACAAPQVHYAPGTSLPPTEEPTEGSLFLVGDVGEANAARDSVLTHLRGEIEATARTGVPVVVAYLGDNIYDVGAREAFIDEDREKLEAQVEPLGTRENVRGVFVPGNHDWAKGASAPVGRNALRVQEEWLADLASGRDVELLPKDTCPGPATLELGESAHLVFIDTEWLLREPVDRCGGADAFYERLTTDLARNRERPVIVMSHHPMVSGGKHGGHISPFQGGPLVFYLATKSGVSIQDIASGAYSGMVERLQVAFDASGGPPLAYAAGHDHNLQVIRMTGPGRPAYQLISGSGSKSSNSGRIEGTRYATNGNGYMRLDFRPTGVTVVVYAQIESGGTVQPVFACVLSSKSGGDDCAEAPLLGSHR